ncbi:nifu-like protein [Phytophthora boehmeriae]|uniref:Nifu-like protein n=1 Tax=Phytophthora boehmeriae TaxID=109152 RepID=A0A8T1X0R6_9STRA|nr:nifu-like protein [Phytophthora boehmeriae]
MSCAGLDDLDELLHDSDNASARPHRKRHYSLNSDNNFTASSFAMPSSPSRHEHPPPPASFPGALRRPDLPPFSGKNNAAGGLYQTPPPSSSFQIRYNQAPVNQPQASEHHRTTSSDEDNNFQQENCEEFNDEFDDDEISYGDKEGFSVPRLASQEQQGSIPGKRVGQNAHLPPSYRWSSSECSPREEFLVQAFGPTSFKLYGSPQASKSELENSYSGGKNNNNGEHKHDTTIPDADAELKMSVNELEEDIRGAIQQQQTSRLPDLGGLAHPSFSSSSHDHFTPNRIVNFNRSSNQDDHHTSTFGHAMDTRVHSAQPQKEVEFVPPQEQQHHSTPRVAPAQFSQPKQTGGVHTSTKWLRDEDERLRVAVARFGGKNWKMIAETLGNGRTDVQCLHRWNKVLKPGLIKGPWTPEEDRVLTNLITRYGVGKIRWCDLALHLPGRIGKQCRERWCNHLDSRIRKGQWTPEEDDMVFRWQQKLGNKWSEIAKMLPGRTENAVKNRFNSAARRKWLMNQANKAPSVPSPIPSQAQPSPHSQLQLHPSAPVPRESAAYNIESNPYAFGVESGKVAPLPRPAPNPETASIAPVNLGHQPKLVPPIGHQSFPQYQSPNAFLPGGSDGSHAVFHPILNKADTHKNDSIPLVTPPIFVPPPLNPLLPPPPSAMNSTAATSRDFHHLLSSPPRDEAVGTFPFASHLPTVLPHESSTVDSAKCTPVGNRSTDALDLHLKAENPERDLVLQSTTGASVPPGGAHDSNVPMDDENMNSFLDSVALELDDIME